MQDIDLQAEADMWANAEVVARPAAEEQRVCWGWSKNKAGLRNYLQMKYRLQEADWKRIWDSQHGKCPGCQRELAHAFNNNPLKLALKPHVGERNREQYGLYCSSCHGTLKVLKGNFEVYARLIEELK
jgi:hypothetical protein